MAVQLAANGNSSAWGWLGIKLIVVKQAGQPITMVVKEIGSALRRLHPIGLKYHRLDNTVSVHPTKLVRDRSLVRIKMKGATRGIV